MNEAAALIDYAGEAPANLAAQFTWWSAAERAQVAVAAIGLLLALWALPRALSVSLATLRDLPQRTFRLLLLAFALGVTLRVLVPARLVMVYSGYELVERSAIFTGIHRYGAGSQTLHSLLFLAFAPDHATLIVLHRVVGALALLPLLAWFARWEPPPLALVLAAFGLATLPLLVRDVATESILVVGALWLWSGLVLLDAPLATSLRGDRWRAVALLAAAAMTRPELTLVAPLLAFLVLRRRGVALGRVHAPLAALFLLLVLPQIWHSVGYLEHDAAQGQSRLGRIFPLGPLAVIGSWLPLWPLAFPLGWTLLVVHSLWRPLTHATWRRLVVVATYVWTLFLLVDLGPLSVPRLEAPIAALWVILGAWHLAEQPVPRRRWLSLLVIATTVPTFSLFQPTNEDDGEAFLQAALTKLPAQDACLVTLTEADPPDKGKVQRAFPDYLLRPPHRTVKRWGMAAWAQAGAPQCAGGTFLLTDHRCHAIFHHPKDAPNVLPICTETRDAHTWEPVFVRQVPNRGVNAYQWFPDVQAFELGLYRLRP